MALCPCRSVPVPGTTAILAEHDGEFDGLCTMGLALGKEINPDCSTNAVIDGKTYCFDDEEAKIEFLMVPEECLNSKYGFAQ